VVEENLYPAMEDFRFDLFIGDGPHAKAVSMQLRASRCLGATTRMGLLSSPLLDRFGFHWQLRYYDSDDLTAIVRRSAGLLDIGIDGDGAGEIARRSRGRRGSPTGCSAGLRDFAKVEGSGRVDRAIAAHALERLQVDQEGLDTLDRGYLQVVIERFDGGPVGIEAIAASLSEERGNARGCGRAVLAPGRLHQRARRAAGWRPRRRTATSSGRLRQGPTGARAASFRVTLRVASALN